MTSTRFFGLGEGVVRFIPSKTGGSFVWGTYVLNVNEDGARILVDMWDGIDGALTALPAGLDSSSDDSVTSALSFLNGLYLAGLPVDVFPPWLFKHCHLPLKTQS